MSTDTESGCNAICSNGERCGATLALNDERFCETHVATASVSIGERRKSESRQCVAIAASTGRRCRVWTGMDDNIYCTIHSARAPDVYHPLCQGFTNTGEPCVNVSKVGYEYCCATHDPWILHYPYQLLDGMERIDDWATIVRHYDSVDLYHRDALDLETPGYVALDHILEKQCFTFAFQSMSLTDEDAQFLIAMVRDEYVNELGNVCLTRTSTHKVKGAAVYKYLDDLRTGHVPEHARFSSYLRNERIDGRRIGRRPVQVVVREMGHALKECQLKLAAQGDTPVLEALSNELEYLFTQMDLKVY